MYIKNQGLNNRIGEINKNKFGENMKIVVYNNCNDIIVKFLDEYGYEVHTNYQWFRNGNVKNLYHKAVYNVGYIGDGEFKSTYKGKDTLQYKCWDHMLERCYNAEMQNKRPTYIGCKVCDEWLNYQNFAKWYEDNFYQIPNEKMQLDKDILHKGNKIYSPNTCIFVPNNINVLFTKHDNKRGDCPIGVSYHKRDNQFGTQCSNPILNRQIWLGYYSNSEKAFRVYKLYKEKLIKQIADNYKNKIPKELYIALYKYEVEITD